MTGQGYPQLTPPNRPRSGPALTVNEPLTPAPTGPGHKYLTSAEVARMMGVSPRAVGKWLEQGKIVPTLRTVGGHARFTVEDVERYKAAAARSSAAAVGQLASGTTAP